MAEYGKKEYWNERFESDKKTFDWYQKYDGLKGVIADNVRKDSQILVVGCGTSAFGADMYEDGYKKIWSIDYSDVCISLMKERYSHMSDMSWSVMDVTDMTVPTGSMSAVFDKGTMDAILCGDSSMERSNKMCEEVSRVLKRDGVFIMVSYGQPDTRLNVLERPDFGWTVTVDTIVKPNVRVKPPGESNGNNVHYVYTCRKM